MFNKKLRVAHSKAYHANKQELGHALFYFDSTGHTYLIHSTFITQEFSKINIGQEEINFLTDPYTSFMNVTIIPQMRKTENWGQIQVTETHFK